MVYLLYVPSDDLVLFACLDLQLCLFKRVLDQRVIEEVLIGAFA
ncbi:hypothetical protein [Cryobacterium lyxosi]|nr:hypothetical protein [Cryobacterium lyxosi]